MNRGPKCNCLPGQCQNLVEPDSKCIFRLNGNVYMDYCPICIQNKQAKFMTWHQDGKCLACNVKT